MSELATYREEKVLEPDEFTLINALRNQDDIPILMDVVANDAQIDELSDPLLTDSSLSEQDLESSMSPLKASRENKSHDNDKTVQEVFVEEVLTDPWSVSEGITQNLGLSGQEVQSVNEPPQTIDLSSADEEESDIPTLTDSENSAQANGIYRALESKLSMTVASQLYSQEDVASAISEVLAKRLPDLVNEVLNTMNERAK